MSQLWRHLCLHKGGKNIYTKIGKKKLPGSMRGRLFESVEQVVDLELGKQHLLHWFA
jgi:hypothetical protein